MAVIALAGAGRKGCLWEEQHGAGRGTGLVRSGFGHAEFQISTRQLHGNAGKYRT